MTIEGALTFPKPPAAILDITGTAEVRELKRMQGFPDDYIIDRDIDWKPYPIKEQVARLGNSVVPVMVETLVRANCSYLKIGERLPNLRINDSENQLKFA